MTLKGFADQAKSADGRPDYATINPVKPQQFGLDVIAHAFARLVGTDSAETGSTTRLIVATAHAALPGDVINFTSGALSGREVRVYSVLTDGIVPAEALPSAPANGNTFEILRQKTPTVSSGGSLETTPGTSATGSSQAKGKLAGTALTGSYQTVVTPGFNARIVQIFNTCNNTIIISLDGGTTEAYELEAGESFSLDLSAAGLRLNSGINIQAKHAGAAPTSGTVRVTCVG